MRGPVWKDRDTDQCGSPGPRARTIFMAVAKEWRREHLPVPRALGTRPPAGAVRSPPAPAPTAETSRAPAVGDRPGQGLPVSVHLLPGNGLSPRRLSRFAPAWSRAALRPAQPDRGIGGVAAGHARRCDGRAGADARG